MRALPKLLLETRLRSRARLGEERNGQIVMARPIFLDHHSTTPVDPRVLQAMLPYFTEVFGNPHSAEHRHGWEAQAAVEDARCAVAALIGAQPAEIIFTSGATEANNLALLGIRLGERRHVVSSSVEHPCVPASPSLSGAAPR